MRQNSGEVVKRLDWTRFNAFEKFGFVALFVFFTFMMFLFFIVPKL